MKNILILILTITSMVAYGQTNWQKGGNANIPFGAPPTIGTAISWNSPLNFVTRGVQRMTILGGLPGGPTTGFVGIGTAFATPQHLLHLRQGNIGVEDGFGMIGASYFPGQTDMVQFQNARINMIVRNKTLGIFCENFGGTPDDVKFADGTDVNTTIYAQDIVPLTIQKGMFLKGSNGNFRMGHFMSNFAIPNIEMDVISTALPQLGGSNPNDFDIIFQGRIHEDTLSNIRLMNATNVDTRFVPMLAGFNSRLFIVPTQTTQGLVVSGAINSSSDIGAGGIGSAIVEFDARIRNVNGTGAVAAVNRDLFQWCNFNVREMLMDANGQLGINTGTPRNRLEINSRTGDPLFGPNGSSGLRLTNMRGGPAGPGIAVPVANPGPGVLSVDANGDVIYVSGGGNGNICGATIVPLANSWEISLPLNTVYSFSDKGTVNITDVTNCAATAKLFVSSGSRQISTGSTNSGLNGFGGYFQSTNTTGTGVYCKAPVTSGPPFTTLPPSLALNVDGDGFVSGKLFLTSAPSIISDQMFKQNTDTIVNALSIVNLLNPVTFEYNPAYNSRFHFSAGINYGFIAQEVETVVPELVTINNSPAIFDTLGNQLEVSLNYKSLNYEGIVPILTKAIKEQQIIIDGLNNENGIQDSINTYLNYKDSLLDYRLTVLESALNTCCSSHSMQQNGNNNSSASQDVELKDGESIVLDQNTPNPFAEQTTINYFLPDNIGKAQMLFYNVQGKLIQSVDLNGKGKGSLNVFASDLSNGIYTYTLIVGGKIVETKKMVKQQ